ncbi:MAG: HD domain-containing protein [Verrucomicrobia bacterium]|nr:HD domain-containing protein [Verrucomicrobiota bacterium]MBU4292015.1 HD domain-containing protein [Verrucomicrobiota bacterium]MBU4427903.1 HD domain-containing protein [Verrucomicrobiota bacterium]MCG2678849.1 HD domain-containing protein [Kiritimatiellia bacterium]
MNSQEFDSIGEWFEGYIRLFADGQGILAPMLQIKADHSRRVAGIMEMIARDMELMADDVRTAYILGLLHDVGRFSQYTEFNTYNDRVSVNHGWNGAEIVLKSKVLMGIVPDDGIRIATGIRHHNEHHLSDSIGDGALLFVKMIRDADKLDICRTMMALWENGELLKYPELVYHIDLKGPPNPMAIAELRAGRTVSYRHIKSMVDFFMTLLSWVYDFNFTVSYRRLAEWDLMGKIVAELPAEIEVQNAAGRAIRYGCQQLQQNLAL